TARRNIATTAGMSKPKRRGRPGARQPQRLRLRRRPGPGPGPRVGCVWIDLHSIGWDALDVLTAVGIWRDRVARTPGEVAYRHHDGGGWRAMTWAEADRAAREIAAGLAALGVATGDRVALLADTRLEWCLVDAGCVLAGAVPVPIYPSSTAAQCAFVVANAGARVAVAENAGQVAKLAPL